MSAIVSLLICIICGVMALNALDKGAKGAWVWILVSWLTFLGYVLQIKS